MTYKNKNHLRINSKRILGRLTQATPVMLLLIVLMTAANVTKYTEYITTKHELKNQNTIKMAEVTLPKYDSNQIYIEGNHVKTVYSPMEEIIETDDKVETEEFTPTVMYCNTTTNIRELPSTDSEILKTISFGSEVTVVNLENGWYELESEGFIREDLLVFEFPAILVSSTAYWDKYNRGSASGRTLVANHSLAGMIEWLGKSVNLYRCNDDGTIGSYIGTYKFDDTGYGAETGEGESVILPDMSIGTIENGTCIDVYMNTESECYQYGRRDVYIEFID